MQEGVGKELTVDGMDLRPLRLAFNVTGLAKNAGRRSGFCLRRCAHLRL